MACYLNLQSKGLKLINPSGMEWENVACVLPIIHTWDFLKYDGMIPLSMCVGSFFLGHKPKQKQGSQAQY